MEYLHTHDDSSLLFLLNERLEHEPRSLWRAELIAQDDQDRGMWFGWSHDSARQADIFDAVVFAAQTGAMNKGEFEPYYPRPTPPATEPVKPKTVMDLDWGRHLGGGTAVV